jgi:glutaminyl-tRNA synthetase
LANRAGTGASCVFHAQARLYNSLYSEAEGDAEPQLNPTSVELRANAKIEPSVRDAPPGSRYQFERVGYFCVDPDSRPGRLVFNRTVALRGTWAKIEKKIK